MNNFLLFLIFSGSLISFPCQSQITSIEDEIMSCYYETLPKKGAEFKKAILEYEEQLIKDGVLKNHSGRSYLRLYKRIETEGRLMFNVSQSFQGVLSKKITFESEQYRQCLMIDTLSKKFKKSKVYLLQKAFKNTYNSGYIQPNMMAKAILSVLDEKDFEKDYYKFIAMVTFDNGTMFGVSEKLPPPQNSNSNTSKMDKKNAFSVFLNAQNEITIKENSFSKLALKEQLTEYLNTHLSKAIVILNYNRNTNYSFYVEITDLVTETIHSLRNIAAIERFEKNFNELNENQRKDIKQLYPKNIIEEYSN